MIMPHHPTIVAWHKNSHTSMHFVTQWVLVGFDYMLAKNIVIVFRIDVSMLPRQGGGYIQCLSDMESPVFGGA